MQIQIQNQKPKVTKMLVELNVNQTDGVFNFEKLKADFKTPLLINFLVSNAATIDTLINYTASYFDKDNNLISTYSGVFDFASSAIIFIPKK